MLQFFFGSSRTTCTHRVGLNELHKAILGALALIWLDLPLAVNKHERREALDLHHQAQVLLLMMNNHNSYDRQA